MNPIQFKDLQLEEQARMIFLKGTFISKIMFFQLGISMYRLNEEFVEIWYNTRTGTIRKIETLKHKKISPFIKHLHIASAN